MSFFRPYLHIYSTIRKMLLYIFILIAIRNLFLAHQMCDFVSSAA